SKYPVRVQSPRPMQVSGTRWVGGPATAILPNGQTISVRRISSGGTWLANWVNASGFTIYSPSTGTATVTPWVPQRAVSLGLLNQKAWPGVGDIDDCAVLADCMAAHASAPWETIPFIADYRAAAGNPDDPHVGDGLTIAQSLQGAGATWSRLK